MKSCGIFFCGNMLILLGEALAIVEQNFSDATSDVHTNLIVVTMKGGNDGKTTSKSGLALNGTSYYRKLRTARSGGSWLQNLEWCPNGQPDYGIDKIR